MKMENNNNFELQEAFDLFDTDGDGQVIEFVSKKCCSWRFKKDEKRYIKQNYFIDTFFDVFLYR